jgi:rhodanese-related sulfurtransferase
MSTFKVVGAGLLVLASLGLVVVPQPDASKKIARQEVVLDESLAAREVQIEPAEMLDLMHNNQVRLVILDVRDEADFNLFHLQEARRVDFPDLSGEVGSSLAPDAVVVLVSNGEERAAQGWRVLKAVHAANAYVLAGGLNRWLETYGQYSEPRPEPVEPIVQAADAPRGEGLRFTFPAAIGDRTEISWPDPHHLHIPEQEFEKKVKLNKTITVAGGGCG